MSWFAAAFAAACLAPPAAETIRIDGTPIQGGLIRGAVPPGTAMAMLEMPGRPATALSLDNGRFLAGFDRDAGSQAAIVATLADGCSVRLPLIVAPRAWRIERVDAPLRAGRSNAEFDAVRPGEIARITAARQVVTQAAGWQEPMRWPARGRLSGMFGAQRVYRGVPGSYHSGTDVALPTGASVMAPAAGVVVLAADPARPFTLEGNLLMIDHGSGLSSAFLHLSRIDVVEGQRITAGQRIGAVGATGRATGPHLHWGLRWRNARLDPLLVAGPMPAR